MVECVKFLIFYSEMHSYQAVLRLRYLLCVLFGVAIKLFVLIIVTFSVK